MKVLITGASSGIGEALAQLLAKKGNLLILAGRNEKRLSAIAQSTNAAERIVADLQTKEGRQKIVTAIQTHLPDVLINNAGFGIYGEATSTPVEQQIALLEVNALAPLEFTLEAARAFLRTDKKGIILNVSSVAGEYPCPGMAVYGASKSFLTMFSRALNFELKSKGIRVLVSCPGLVKSEFASRAAKKHIELEGGPIIPVEKAAEEIWKQIVQQKEKHSFTFYYRFGSWFAKNFVPTALIMRIIWKSIMKRID